MGTVVWTRGAKIQAGPVGRLICWRGRREGGGERLFCPRRGAENCNGNGNTFLSAEDAEGRGELQRQRQLLVFGG